MYTEDELSLANLKGRDLARIQTLRDAAADLPIDIFLCILEKVENGSCEIEYPARSNKRRKREDDSLHKLDDILWTSFGIHELVDLDGTKVGETMPLDEDDIMQYDCFKDADGEELDYVEAYSGNEGGPRATHAYQVSGIVMVPRVSILHFLTDPFTELGSSIRELKDDVCFNAFITYYAKKCLEPAKEGQYAEPLATLRALCTFAWTPEDKNDWRPKMKTETTTLLLQTLTQLRQWSFFEQVIRRNDGMFDAKTVLTWIVKAINDSSNSNEDVGGVGGVGGLFSEVEGPLLRVLATAPSISSALTALDVISSLSSASNEVDVDPARQQDETPVKLAWKQWTRKAIDALLATLTSKKVRMTTVRDCSSTASPTVSTTSKVLPLRCSP